MLRQRRRTPRSCGGFPAIAALLGLGVMAGIGASPAAAQTTGGVVGRVTDAQGGALPGVTVEARSPALQGTRTATTDGTGLYHLTLLPPGSYTIAITLEGFSPESRPAVGVDLDKETTVNAVLHPAVAESITVTGEVPAIDLTSPALGTNLDSRAVETLPSGRNYSSVVQITPGVSSDANPENTSQSTISVYGSTGNENVFYIDGVNTTGAEYGFQGKELNFEFIQAIDVKSGGYEAEYGRATGGIINVITKSGGNEYHGDVFGYYDNNSLQGSTSPVVSDTGTVVGFTRKDYGLDLGGFLIKDRIWFFGAYDRVNNTLNSQQPPKQGSTQPGPTVATDSTHDLAAAKLTFHVTQSQTVFASFFQDPRDDAGAIIDANHTLNGDPLTDQGKLVFGGKDYALRYEGLFGNAWVLSGQVARHNEANSVDPATAAGDVVEFRDTSNGLFQTGGFGLIQEKTFKRDFAGGALARYLGGHEIKLGLEYEKNAAKVTRRFSGGQQVDVFPVAPGETVYSHFYWTTPSATVADAPVSALNASPQQHNTTAYLQDHWSALSNLTINAGVRWDRQQIIDPSGNQVIDLKKDFAPRLGFVWDPTRNGRSKVFGSYGRYYEEIPMDLVIRSFSFERQARIFNFSPTGTTPDPAAEAAVGQTSAIFGGNVEPADPNLHNQYLNEYLVGYQREVLPDVTAGIQGIYRAYGQVIEDFLCRTDGTYCIGNPGQGIMQRIFTLDYSQTFPAPKPKRVYKAIQLDLNKRFSHNWQALASYVYSKLDGNYDGTYAPFTNVGADPNISAAYDYYDFFTNGINLNRITDQGPLSNDRRHQLKLSGIYITPFKLSVGLSAYYRSGTPVTAYGYSDIYARYEFFLTDRGALGRTPSNYDADLHLGYPLPVGPVTLNILFDVFNLFNTQRPILLDERWDFKQADNASPTPANTNFGKPVLRTPPTSLRLGVRLSL
jgi:Carboxypeptidase regulatory-like domain/TonB dependent receptor-like, beta-barrel/TonB-dependent Receptor Plug Domain